MTTHTLTTVQPDGSVVGAVEGSTDQTDAGGANVTRTETIANLLAVGDFRLKS